MNVAAELRKLPRALAELQRQTEQHAVRYGLDCFPILFELVTADQLHAIAACGGFPTRYPHWRWGMEYERLTKGYSYGLQKIYELVINNDPCYAYLLDSNALTDHKLVIAHVYGHCDFFKNNAWFSQTNRNMIDEMANHGNRIRKYMDRFGVETVENFIDACLSVEDLIDIHSPFIRRAHAGADKYEFRDAADDSLEPSTPRFPAKSYMDAYINPPDALAAEHQRRQQAERPAGSFPAQPTQDVMLFVLDNAPLKPWQHDILSIVREEAYYFAPQAQTKIMNEGWASYWHSTLMTRHAMDAADLICYANHCAGTFASAGMRLNPYKLGIELFRDIEDRWNRGCHGDQYERCDDMVERREWNTHEGLGRKKIFEVRRVHNDLTFIDEFLTLEFCQRHNLFQFGYNEDLGHWEIACRKFQQIKQQLLANLTNIGRPIIRVVDGNHKNRGELYLKHQWSGVELQRDYASDTLENLHTLWRRPVHIQTVFEGQPTVLSYDGKRRWSTQLESSGEEDEPQQ